jgi:hypothetical protein
MKHGHLPGGVPANRVLNSDLFVPQWDARLSNESEADTQPSARETSAHDTESGRATGVAEEGSPFISSSKRGRGSTLSNMGNSIRFGRENGRFVIEVFGILQF